MLHDSRRQRIVCEARMRILTRSRTFPHPEASCTAQRAGRERVPNACARAPRCSLPSEPARSLAARVWVRPPRQGRKLRSAISDRQKASCSGTGPRRSPRAVLVAAAPRSKTRPGTFLAYTGKLGRSAPSHARRTTLHDIAWLAVQESRLTSVCPPKHRSTRASLDGQRKGFYADW